MSSDDDDYMSASFTNVTEDIRPGLVKSNTIKRKYEIEQKAKESNKRHQTKPLRVLEEESRNIGLNAALSSDNKGFAMLQKMGYKPGMKLGPQKNEKIDSGLKEPIKIQLKTGRGGLGREEIIKQKIKEKEEKRAKIKVYKERETERLTEDFRKRMRDKVMLKQNQSNLNKMRSVCERLDVEENVKEPMRPWFWRSTQQDYEEEDDEDYEEEDEEQLEIEDQLYFINDYLRSKYFYCVWCGLKYEDEKDMQSNCPGPDKDDHDE